MDGPRDTAREAEVDELRDLPSGKEGFIDRSKSGRLDKHRMAPLRSVPDEVEITPRPKISGISITH